MGQTQFFSLLISILQVIQFMDTTQLTQVNNNVINSIDYLCHFVKPGIRKSKKHISYS